jgi:hypothetical protein
MAKTKLICPICKVDFEKENAAINRANKSGANIYCGKVCAGVGRGSAKTKEEKTKDKAEYDRQYREKNREKRKAQKAEYYQRTRDPEKERVYRKANMQRHIEYCRRPEYKEKKKAYDRTYNAKLNYGEFWESALLIQDIDNECKSRESNYRIKLENGLLCKSQKRKRACQNLTRKT